MNEKALLEKRARVWAQMQEIRDRSKDGLSAEDRTAWDAAEVELTTLSEDIDRAQRDAKRAAIDYSQVLDARGVKGEDREPVDEDGTTKAEVKAAESYRSAFIDYLRRGKIEMPNKDLQVLAQYQGEQRAQGIGTLSAGGYTVPPLFRDVLIERLKYFSGMRDNSTVIQTSQGGPLPWMTNDDTANVGAILGENTQVTELDLTFGTATFDVFMYTSLMVQVSIQLLQDSAVDLETFLPRKLGERIGRIQNTHFTVGTGSGQPQGIVTGGTSVALATGNTTGFSYAGLIQASHGRLDPAYLGGSNNKWMGSQAAITSFLLLTDSQNRPLWQPSLVVGAPDTLLGHAIILNNDMPVPAANAKSLIFGDIEASYVIRDVVGLSAMRLDERYADYFQVAFVAFMRSGGIVQNTNSYTIIANSAT